MHSSSRRTVRTLARIAVAYVALVASVVTGEGAAAAAARGSRALSLPQLSGLRTVGAHTIVVDDPNRPGRRIPVQLWYPAAPSSRSGARAPYALPQTAAVLAEALGVPVDAVNAIDTHTTIDAPRARGGPFPVVLFSPGLGFPRFLYTGLATQLASAGYVVAVLDHPGEALLVEFPDGSVILRDGSPPSPAMIATNVDDARSVLAAVLELNEQAGSLLYHGINPARVGFVGHSLGGATAAEMMRVDSLVRVGVDLDGSLWPPVANVGVDRPLLLFSARTPVDGTWSVQRQKPDTLALVMEDAGHHSFTDVQVLDPAPDRSDDGIGTIDRQRSFRAQTAYVTAFLDRHLRGAEERLLDGPSPKYPEVCFVSV